MYADIEGNGARAVEGADDGREEGMDTGGRDMVARGWEEAATGAGVRVGKLGSGRAPTPRDVVAGRVED
jgi:hypothetical protein